MFKLSDLLPTRAPSARKMLEQKLNGATYDSGSFHPAKVMNIVQEGYDTKALDAILRKKSKKGQAFQAAELIKSVEEARAALKGGDVGPAVSMVAGGSALCIFETVVSDKSDPNALEACLQAMPLLSHGINRTGQGDYNCAQGAKRYAKEAIEGFAQLNDQEKCRDAMMRVQSEVGYKAQTDYINHYAGEFIKGPAGNEIAGMVAYGIKKENDQLGFDDHLAAVKYHADDKEKIAAITALSGYMNKQNVDDPYTHNVLDAEQDAAFFTVLKDHIKTTNGQSQPSQFTAMKSLMDNHKNKFETDGWNIISKEGEEVLNIVREEMLLGSPHVVQEGFINGGMLHVLDMHEKVSRDDPKARVTITDILPSDIGGTQVNQARHAYSEKMLGRIATGVSKGYDVSDDARTVALLARDVLQNGSDESPGRGDEIKAASTNLRQLISMETAAQRISHEDLQKTLAVKELEWNSHSYTWNESYKEPMRKEIVAEHNNKPALGYGRAMVGALSTNPLMADVVTDIEKDIPQPFEPKVLVTEAKHELCAAVPTAGLIKPIAVMKQHIGS